MLLEYGVQRKKSDRRREYIREAVVETLKLILRAVEVLGRLAAR